MRVLLATSWDTPCGIAEHARLLIEHARRADPGIAIMPSAEALDPEWIRASQPVGYPLVHLNHHDALHSRWTPAHVQRLRERRIEVLVTYHDTTEDPSPTSKLAQLAQVASSVVVHEPLHQGSGVKAIYWRQGVPEAARQPMDLHTFRPFTAYPQQPILGTIGFNFPWKNYDRLCQTTADLGWALLLLANNATEADVARWTAINPYTLVMRRFLEGATAVDWLAGCDATAFMYECANTGTSGAIRLGIAARKPVIALDSCRQFRDLYLDHLGTRTIQWVRDWSALEARLIQGTHGARYDPGIVALAHQESWRGLGQQYAQLYRMLVGESRV